MHANNEKKKNAVIHRFIARLCRCSEQNQPQLLQFNTYFLFKVSKQETSYSLSFCMQRSWVITWKPVTTQGLSVGEGSPQKNHKKVKWESLLLWVLTLELKTSRQAIYLLLATWVYFVSEQGEGPGLKASFMFCNQLANTITHCEQLFSLTFGKNYYLKSKRKVQRASHMQGRFSPRFLGPA